MKKVLLYSGGLDSYLISKIWKPDVRLYIDVGSSYSEIEMKRLPSDVIVEKFPIGKWEDKESKYIPLRNLYFLMIASNYGDELCLGATAGDRDAPDKTPDFLDRAESMINSLLKKQNSFEGWQVTIERRFVEMTKEDIIKEYLRNGGSVDEVYNNTFSCYNPDTTGKPCLSCKACFRWFMTLYAAGYQFNNDEKNKMARYVKNVALPGAYKGTYYTKRYKEGPQIDITVKEFCREMGL